VSHGLETASGTSAAMLQELQRYTTEPIFNVLFYAYLLVLRLSIWFRQIVIYQSSPVRRRGLDQAGSILIIGDGLAEGVGDHLSHGGLATRVNALLHRQRERTKLMFSWQVLTAGRLYSTSADWLPVAATVMEERAALSAGEPSLFRRTFITGPFRGANVVVIVVGSHEDPADGAATAVNIARLGDALGRMGKHVLVSSIPSYCEAGTDGAKAGFARNEALSASINALPANVYAVEGGSVSYGVDLQKIVSRGGDVAYEEASFITLNPIGFRALAREVHDAVAVVAKRVEWAHWKSRIRPTS
jgi:hypothetical protein